MTKKQESMLGVRELDDRTRVIETPAANTLDPAAARQIEDIFRRAFKMQVTSEPKAEGSEEG